VGNNPKAASSVRQTNGVCRYNVPFCIVPEVGKLTEDNAKSLISQIFNIFDDDPVGVGFANQPMIFEPEARTVAEERILPVLVGGAYILAGKPAR